jgi:GAF domain
MTAMLSKSFEKISECLARAADLRARADIMTNAAGRAELLKLES